MCVCVYIYIYIYIEERETTWFNRQQLFQPLDRFHHHNYHWLYICIYIYVIYVIYVLALTRKICGILSKKLQKLALLKL